jgi:hypothetical protein
MKLGVMKALTFIAALVGLIVNVSVQAAHASTVTFVTPTGSTESGGNPVNVSATFTTSDRQIAVTLTDLLLPLFGTGLVALVLLRWRRKKAKID